MSTSTQPRQPQGSPVGGQFAAVQHPDGPDLPGREAAAPGQLDVVLKDRINKWVMENLDTHAEVQLLELLDIDEDRAVEEYGPEVGDQLARLEVVVDSETSELSSPIFEGPLAGPAEYATDGFVSIVETDHRSYYRLICSSQFTDEDPPKLPPFSTWSRRLR